MGGWPSDRDMARGALAPPDHQAGDDERAQRDAGQENRDPPRPAEGFAAVQRELPGHNDIPRASLAEMPIADHRTTAGIDEKPAAAIAVDVARIERRNQ